MDHMISEMLEVEGLPAFVAGMAMLAKYILTMFFLGYESSILSENSPKTHGNFGGSGWT